MKKLSEVSLKMHEDVTVKCELLEEWFDYPNLWSKCDEKTRVAIFPSMVFKIIQILEYML